MSDAGLVALRGGSVVTVGTFDGVHLGHRAILRDLNERAERMGLPAVVATFTPHPLAVVNVAAAPKLLTPGAERLIALAGDAASRYAVIIPFSVALAALSAEQFVRLLVTRYGMRELVVGYDHGLGRGRQGDVDVLRALGRQLGFTVAVVPAENDAQGVAISSTAIRRAVAYGDLDAARARLGRRYLAHGVVIRGKNRGRQIGVPTINLAIPTEKLLPPDGVYAVRVSASKGSFGGMMNLGGRPTFDDAERVPEIHMFGAGGDWYGDSVCVEFVSRLRDTVRFAGLKELTEQLARDADSARLALTQA
jgi:riboflavin kinase / FMN adenylyltransferase